MATRFRATTYPFIATGELDARVRENALPTVRLDVERFNVLTDAVQEQLAVSLEVRSRGGWLMEAVDRLGRAAALDELCFLGGVRNAAAPRSADVVRGATSSRVTAHAFVLDADAIAHTDAAIARAFAWSSANAASLAAGLFSAHANTADVVQAVDATTELERAVRTPNGRLQWESTAHLIPGHEDGDGPGMLYAWLRSVRRVLATASTLGQPVLHVVDAMD